MWAAQSAEAASCELAFTPDLSECEHQRLSSTPTWMAQDQRKLDLREAMLTNSYACSVSRRHELFATSACHLKLALRRAGQVCFGANAAAERSHSFNSPRRTLMPREGAMLSMSMAVGVNLVDSDCSLGLVRSPSASSKARPMIAPDATMCFLQ